MHNFTETQKSSQFTCETHQWLRSPWMKNNRGGVLWPLWGGRRKRTRAISTRRNPLSSKLAEYTRRGSGVHVSHRISRGVCGSSGNGYPGYGLRLRASIAASRRNFNCERWKLACLNRGTKREEKVRCGISRTKLRLSRQVRSVIRADSYISIRLFEPRCVPRRVTSPSWTLMAIMHGYNIMVWCVLGTIVEGNFLSHVRSFILAGWLFVAWYYVGAKARDNDISQFEYS